jgi:hypothetical protein
METRLNELLDIANESLESCGPTFAVSELFNDSFKDLVMFLEKCRLKKSKEFKALFTSGSNVPVELVNLTNKLLNNHLVGQALTILYSLVVINDETDGANEEDTEKEAVISVTWFLREYLASNTTVADSIIGYLLKEELNEERIEDRNEAKQGVKAAAYVALNALTSTKKLLPVSNSANELIRCIISRM